MGCVLNVYERNANGQKWFFKCGGFLVVVCIKGLQYSFYFRQKTQFTEVQGFLAAFTVNINFNVHSLWWWLYK